MLDPDLELRQIAAEKRLARANRLHHLHPVLKAYVSIFVFAFAVSGYIIGPIAFITLLAMSWKNLFWPLALAATGAIVMVVPIYAYLVYRVSGPFLDVLDWMFDGPDEIKKELAKIDIEARRRLHELGP